MNVLNKEQILKKGQKVAKIATLSTIFLIIFKALAGFLSGSVLLIADAIHSAVDTIAIFSSWFGLKISQKKLNSQNPIIITIHNKYSLPKRNQKQKST